MGPAVLGRTSSWREDAFVDKPLAKVDAVIEIDLQGNDSGPAGRRPAHQHRTVPAKMPRPLMTAGMEQRNNLLCPGVNSGNIRPFVTVARKTGQAGIICLSPTQVMFGDDVIDLEWKVEILPRDLAVFATSPCPFPDEVFEARSMCAQCTSAAPLSCPPLSERLAFDFIRDSMWPTRS